MSRITQLGQTMERVVVMMMIVAMNTCRKKPSGRECRLWRGECLNSAHVGRIKDAVTVRNPQPGLLSNQLLQ